MTDQPQPPDPNRRRFFRLFAGDVASSLGSMMGVVQAVQQTSAEAARDLLGVDPLGLAPAAALPSPSTPAEVNASNAGYRAPFRWDGDVCYVVDQRRLPDVLVDIEVRGAAEAVNAINDGGISGAQVQAQLAAVTLAIVASRSTASRSFARRATIRGAANAFRLARPGSAPMAAALARLLALLDQLGLDAEGDAIAAAFVAEAERIVAEATEDHGSLVANIIKALPGDAGAPLHVMVSGSTGAMGSGQFGGALSAIMTAHHDGRPIHALIPEGRPGFEASRVAAWELRQAGVPHAVLTDAAAPGCISADEVKVVLSGAERITANGDVIAPVGTYGLALAAYAASIPFLVCAPTTAIDLTMAEGADATIEEGRPTAVLRAAGNRVAPEGTQIRNPLQDLVPGSLVTAIVTETGILTAPFEEPLAAAVGQAGERRSSSPGFAALLAQREATAREAGEAAARAEAGEPAPEKAAAATPVDVAALRNPPRPPGYVPPLPHAVVTDPAPVADPAPPDSSPDADLTPDADTGHGA